MMTLLPAVMKPNVCRQVKSYRPLDNFGAPLAFEVTFY